MKTLEYKVVESDRARLFGVIYSENGHVTFTAAPMHTMSQYSNGYFNNRGRFCTNDGVKWSDDRKLLHSEFNTLFNKLGSTVAEFEKAVKEIRKHEISKLELVKSLTLSYVKEQGIDPNDLEACYELALKRANITKGAKQ